MRLLTAPLPHQLWPLSNVTCGQPSVALSTTEPGSARAALRVCPQALASFARVGLQVHSNSGAVPAAGLQEREAMGCVSMLLPSSSLATLCCRGRQGGPALGRGGRKPCPHPPVLWRTHQGSGSVRLRGLPHNPGNQVLLSPQVGTGQSLREANDLAKGHTASR